MRASSSLVVLLVLAHGLTAAPPVTALAYRADGALLAAGTHGTVTLVDPKTGDRLGELPNIPGRVTAVAFSSKHRLAVAAGEPGKSGVVRLYDLPAGKPIDAKPKAEFTAHRDAIYALAFSPDGTTLATGGYDRLIKLWNVDQPAEPKLTLKDHADAVYCVAFHPAGQLLASGAADRAVKIWDTTTGKRLYTLGDSTDWVYSVAWLPDGSRLAAAGVDKSLRIWSADAKEGKLVAAVFAHTAAVTRVAPAADGKTVYTVGDDNTIKAWDAAKLAEKTVFPKLADTTLAFALRPDGRQFAVGLFNGTGQFLADPDGRPAGQFLPVKPKPPTVGTVEPNEFRLGTGTRVTVTGERLDTVTELKLGETPAKILSRTAERIIAEVAPAVVGPTVVGVQSPAGAATGPTVFVDRFAVVREATGTTDSARTGMPVQLPASIVGTLDRAGDTDYYTFEATAGQQIGVQVIKSGNKLDPLVTLADATGTVLAESGSGALGYTVPSAGRYAVGLQDKEYRGGSDMGYRLHVGNVPVVTGVFPLGVPRGRATTVRVSGVNLAAPNDLAVKVDVPANKPVGERVTVPVPSNGSPVVGTAAVVVGEFEAVVGTSSTTEIQTVPTTVDGILARPGDVSIVRFPAKKGERVALEVHGRRLGSPIDPSIDVTDAAGTLLHRATLRAVAKTYTTLRDHNATTAGIRLETWNELGMKDLMYANGELMRIFRLPLGPDEDTFFFQTNGVRTGYGGTTPKYHAFASTFYKVELHPPGTSFPPNGLPVFPLAYQNDDGGPGFGKDAFLLFDPPADGLYQVRLRDGNGQGGPAFAYRLTVRKPRPSFTVSVSPMSPGVWVGGGIPVTVTADRRDGFDGAIRLRLTNLPNGFTAPETTIEAGHLSAVVTLFAEPTAAAATTEAMVEASAYIDGQRATATATLGRPKTLPSPTLATTVSTTALRIRPGEETKFRVIVDRKGFKGRIPLEVRGLPYGVYVRHIGLNGILLTERDSERDVFIYAEPWVEPMTRPVSVSARLEKNGQEFAARSVTLTVAP